MSPKLTPLVMIAANVLGAATGGCGRALLTADDVVCMPGRSTIFVAHLEYKTVFDMRDGVEDHPITFWAGPTQVGIARTDDEGRARLVRQPSIKPATTTCAATARVHGVQLRDERPIHYWRPDRVIVVIDVDKTLSDTDYDDLLLDAIDEESQPYPGSVAALHNLQRDYHLLYLTARPRFLMEKTRDWLHRHHYPDAPLVTAPSIGDVFHPAQMKRAILAARRELWPNLLIGIGDQPSDVSAYSANGMLSILLGPEAPAPPTDQDVVRLPDWASVGSYFAQHAAVLRDPQHLARVLRQGPAIELGAATPTTSQPAAPKHDQHTP